MTYSWDRICYVVPSLGVGGSERQLVQLMRGLERHFEVMVVCTRSDGALAGDARRIGVVRVLNTRSGWDPRVRPRVQRELMAYKPAIVHSLMFGFDYPINVAARNAGVPVVLSSRRQLAHWKKPRHLRLQRRANRLVDGIVANSKAVVDFAAEQEHVDPGMFHVVYNGIDPDRFQSDTDPSVLRRRYGVPFHTEVVGMVANFSDEKDHALFVRIAERVLKLRANVHFVLVGTGPLREAVARDLELAGIADQVTMMRTVSELPDLYGLMSIFLLCSKSEGFPNVVLEAMAAGNPIVASAVGGIPEVIDDGVNGRLVATRDPDDFSNAILWYLDHPDEAEAIGAQAEHTVRERFSVERMVETYRRLYKNLLEHTRRGSRAG